MKNLYSRKFLALLVVIILNVINALVGILGNLVSKDIESILVRVGISEYLVQITSGLLITGVLLAAWVFKAERDARKEEIQLDPVPDSEKSVREFLSVLANRFEERRVHKLDRRYEISLVVNDGVEDSSMCQFDEDFESEAPIGKAAQHIIDRFEKKGRLLIIGSPGAGKTVLLLTLAQYLAEKANANVSQPLPVILNLDTWSSDYKSFEDWAIAMLMKGYGLSPDFASALLAEHRIVFLLDGLDELARNEEDDRAAKIRADCIASIDKSLHDGTMNVVICCRRKEFEAMLRQSNTELPVAGIVVVRDLSAEQIDRALIRASQTRKDRFAAQHLLAALGQDRNGIYEQVLSTPFYFTTALQVFDSTKSPVIGTHDKKTLKANLIEAFIDKKLKVTKNAGRFPAGQTIAWLTWLATFLESNSVVTFELADLQPSALKKPWQYSFTFCMIFGVIGGTIFGRATILDTVFFLFLFGMIGSFIVIEGLGPWALEPLQRWRTWRNILLQALLGGGLFSAIFLSWLQAGQRIWQMLVTFLVIAIVLMPILVVGGVLIRIVIRLIGGVFIRASDTSIKTEDFAEWTLKPLLQGHTWSRIFLRALSNSIFASIVFSILWLLLSIYMFYGKVTTSNVIVAMIMLFMAALVSVTIVLIVSLPLGIIKACRQTARIATINSPYQRVRAGTTFSILQSTIVATIILVPILIWLSRGMSGSSDKNNLLGWVVLFVTCAFFGFFRSPLFKHLVLRACLTREGAIPIQYSRFLIYAAELGILEREGGQWRFRHQTLQDHFVRRAGNTEHFAEANGLTRSGDRLAPIISD